MFVILKISGGRVKKCIYISKKIKLKLCGNQLRNFLVLVRLR